MELRKILIQCGLVSTYAQAKKAIESWIITIISRYEKKHIYKPAFIPMSVLPIDIQFGSDHVVEYTAEDFQGLYTSKMCEYKKNSHNL
jgi:hypothetical protein